jgi:hypothetical protein
MDIEKLLDHAALLYRPEVTERRSGTHRGTERERIACRKTLASGFPHNFSFRQGLSHMESARFWPFRTTIGWCRESSVFPLSH